MGKKKLKKKLRKVLSENGQLKSAVKHANEGRQNLFNDFVKYIENPTSYEAIQIRSRIEMEVSTQRILMYGVKNFNMRGLLDKLATVKPDDTFSWKGIERDKPIVNGEL